MGTMNSRGMAMAPPADDAAAAPDDAGGGGESVDGRTPNSTPEEQKQYSDFVNNGMLLIYENDKAFNGIRAKLKAGAADDPVAVLAGIVVMIVERLEASAPGPLDPAILLQGGTELGMQIAEIAERDGTHTYSEKEIEAAAYRAADQYRLDKKSSGKLDSDSAKRDLQALQDDQQSGKLDQQLPGLKEHFAGQQQQAEEGAPPDDQGGAPPSGVRGFGAMG